MHHKNIKVIVKRQLKKDNPDWRSLTKKEKRVLSKQVTETVVNDYDFKMINDKNLLFRSQAKFFIIS